jgi:hypothetical protein
VADHASDRPTDDYRTDEPVAVVGSDREAMTARRLVMPVQLRDKLICLCKRERYHKQYDGSQ